MTLAVVTATADLERSRACRSSWWRTHVGPVARYIVVNGAGGAEPRGWQESGKDQPAEEWAQIYHVPSYLGVIPAFATGVSMALADGYDVIACFHDDLELQAHGWDQSVLLSFAANHKIGLMGFGGAMGLGDDKLYLTPYYPMQLARQSFRSNMRDAEAHGTRTTRMQRVACVDGFSLIGRRAFWQGWYQDRHGRHSSSTLGPVQDESWNLLGLMAGVGLRHHFYDSALGCYAARLGWETWLLPLPCHHHGGITAVQDQDYHAWAQQEKEGGDAGFWEHAHQWGYEEFRDVLPLRVLPASGHGTEEEA